MKSEIHHFDPSSLTLFAPACMLLSHGDFMIMILMISSDTLLIGFGYLKLREISISALSSSHK